jgi:hypothetical protein
MSDFNFRKPLSSQKKNLNEALQHINRLYNNTLSAGRVDVVGMELNEAERRPSAKSPSLHIRKAKFGLDSQGKGRKGDWFHYHSQKPPQPPYPTSCTWVVRARRELALNLWPESWNPTHGRVHAGVCQVQAQPNVAGSSKVDHGQPQGVGRGGCG